MTKILHRSVLAPAGVVVAGLLLLGLVGGEQVPDAPAPALLSRMSEAGVTWSAPLDAGSEPELRGRAHPDVETTLRPENAEAQRDAGLLDLLARCETEPSAELAEALIASRGRIPTGMLGAYARASAGLVAALAATGDTGLDRPAGEVLAGRVGELALSALEAQAAELAARSTSGLDAWRSACVTVERIGWVAAGYTRLPAYEKALEPLRREVERMLLSTADSAGAWSLSAVEAAQLGSLIGDSRTAEFIERLRQHPSMKGSMLTREAFLVRRHALRMAIRHGSTAQRMAAVDWLAEAMARATTPAEHAELQGHVDALLQSESAVPTIRDQVVGLPPLR